MTKITAVIAVIIGILPIINGVRVLTGDFITTYMVF